MTNTSNMEIEPIKESYELFKIKPNGENKIPKIIYRTSSYDMMCLPYTVWELYKKEKELNREYEYFYFDDFQCEAYIEMAYGNNIRDAYLKLIPPAFRADLFRYLILYDRGGIYMDFTQHCLKPMDYIIKDYKEVYVSDFYTVNEDIPKCALYQAFIATIKGTKLLETTINMCLENIKNEFYGKHTLDVTGPSLIGKAFRKLQIDGMCDSDEYINAGKISDDFYIYNFDKVKYGEYIVNPETDELLLKNKLDYHYKLTYNNNKNKRYPYLYENKMVYDTYIKLNL